MNLYIVDYLILLETIKSQPRYSSVKDKLSLVENISVELNHKQISDKIEFRENIRYSFTNKRYIITDHLAFQEKISTPKDLAQFYQHLNLTEHITVVKNNTISDVLKFKEAILFRHRSPSKHVTDTIVFEEHISIYKPDDRISPNSLDPETGSIRLLTMMGMSEDCPVYIQELPYITFTGIGGNLVLNAPDKGNTDTLSLGRINRRTRSGDLILKAIPLRPRSNILKFTIHIYHPPDRFIVSNFFKMNLGKIITILDHEHVTHSGILTHTPEFVEDIYCAYVTELEFLTII